MTVDSWQPAPASNTINSESLSRLLSCADDFSESENCTPDHDWIQPLVQVDNKIWASSIDKLDDDQLISLIKLLTTLELKLNWDLSEQSPVIAIFKVLKKRAGINKPLVKWIKANTDNKYLPFGPLL